MGGNRDEERAISKGKDAMGARVKRKSTGDTVGPSVKWPHVEPATPNVDKLDQMEALLNRMWDKVVVAREIVCMAKGGLQAVEGHLHMMEDWVRDMHCRA